MIVIDRWSKKREEKTEKDEKEEDGQGGENVPFHPFGSWRDGEGGKGRDSKKEKGKKERAAVIFHGHVTGRERERESERNSLTEIGVGKIAWKERTSWEESVKRENWMKNFPSTLLSFPSSLFFASLFWFFWLFEIHWFGLSSSFRIRVEEEAPPDLFKLSWYKSHRTRPESKSSLSNFSTSLFLSLSLLPFSLSSLFLLHLYNYCLFLSFPPC